LLVPEVDGSYQAGQPGWQKVKTMLRERVDFTRFSDDRLKAGVRRKQSADFGGLHGTGNLGGGVQVILITSRLAKARSLSLSLHHVLASAAVGIAVIVCLAGALYWFSLRFAADLKIPLVRELVLAAQKSETERSREFMQQNLNSMAVKIGEMQAQLTRLDALGERLSTMAGIRPQEFRFSEAPGMGGAQSTTMPPQNLTLTQFNEKVAMLSRQMESRTDMLGVLEAQMFEQAVKKKAMPTMMPVAAQYNASTYGMRIDPFTGQQAMHEGIDFVVDVGTPVVAAAGGVVQFAGFHPQYGNMIDIDHGNDLVTRYAHLSKVLVKEGDVLQRGRHIGDSGNTGRTTGPHLHFEVRYRGTAQNPTKFLLAANPQLPLAKAKP
jgi:murein DD-endopeptidase MepM/ murein hydrolase activator NlpD